MVVNLSMVNIELKRHAALSDSQIPVEAALTINSKI
jgi:hypothetical protein